MDEAAKAANLGEPRSAATVFEDIVDSMDTTSAKRIEHENRTSPDTLAILGQMLVWSTTACRHTSI